MTTENTTTGATIIIDGVTFITVADFARDHGLSGDRLRGMARKARLTGAKQLFGKTWVIPADAPAPAPTAARTQREDGRRPFTIYATADEYAALLDAGHIVTDPRERSRERRAQRKTA